MNKRVYIAFLLLLFPLASFAETLSFQPPTTDVSVIFLGNIFGIVDGVLSGTGSQIVGQMFAVFNSALLALGGIVLFYVILVSTLNTAQQGEMLGQKWSSIWVPLRLVIGLGMLVPKTTGYCLLQIIIMWIVVQGVGAADKVWNAALSYLNRGGVIIQAQIGGESLLTSGSSDIAKGATAILSGQVCMIALQQQLQSLRATYDDAGMCSKSNSNYHNIKYLCENDVPSFINSVNAVSFQDSPSNTAPYTMQMPNLSKDQKYSQLNGVCGSIGWNGIPSSTTDPTSSGLTSSEQNTVSMSRAIAVQQMFMDLSSVANMMVANDPSIYSTADGDTTTSTGSQAVKNVAKQQFGVPMDSSQAVCASSSSACTVWGPDSNLPVSSTQFVGTEFQSAIADYNGVMAPTLNLEAEQAAGSQADAAKKFIASAEAQGWMLAGSYFYNLAALNTMGMNNNSGSGGTLTDTQSGLGNSYFNTKALTCDGDGSNASLCNDWFVSPYNVKLNAILQLLTGSTGSIDSSTTVKYPVAFPPTGGASEGAESVTTYGYINNASLIQLPGQVGFAPPAFKFTVPLTGSTPLSPLPKQNFGNCGSFGIPCLTATLFWNLIVRTLYNMFLSMVAGIINSVVLTFLALPLQVFGRAFNEGLKVLQTPNINPIIALAKMGAYYVNYAMNMWIELIMISIVNVMIPWFGIFVGILIALSLPLILAWTGVMVSVGFSTAYYVPFLPYMIFTFGSIGWIIAVIEAMVAGPIVALGITHPEGHDVLGKADQAIMLVLNVFLRPAMMIIGYIIAIALTYVGVWILNAGFDNAVYFMSGVDPSSSTSVIGTTSTATGSASSSFAGDYQTSTAGYTSWAAIYAQFFGVLVYTTMYLTIVQKAFTLISHLPDKVLRWVGSQSESLGEQTAGWTQDSKDQVKGASDSTDKAGQEVTKKMKAGGDMAGDQMGSDSTPSSSAGGGGKGTSLSGVGGK